VSCDAGDGLCNCVAPQPKHSPSAACVKDPPISFSFTSRLDGFAFTVLRIRYFHSDSAANGRGPAGVGYLACARGVQLRNHHTSRTAERPGDNLYTASLLAFRPKAGEIVWYYQFTPNETYDFDATWEPILADIRVNGEERNVVMQLNRNGFLYVLDRTNVEAALGQAV
jgi:hypothetical protein